MRIKVGLREKEDLVIINYRGVINIQNTLEILYFKCLADPYKKLVSNFFFAQGLQFQGLGLSGLHQPQYLTGT